MKKTITLAVLLLSVTMAMAQKIFLTSSNGRLEVMIENNGGQPTYTVYYDSIEVISPSRLGFEADFGDFSKGMTLKEKPANDTLSLMPSGFRDATYILRYKKLKQSTYMKTTHSYEIPFRNAKGQEMTVEFRMSNNNLAFRYVIPRPGERSAQGDTSLAKTPLSKLILLTDQVYPRIQVTYGGVDEFRGSEEIDVEQFITVKGFKAKGKRLTTYQIESITELEPTRFPEPPEVPEDSDDPEFPDDLDPDAGKSEQQVIDEITGQTNLFAAFGLDNKEE